MDDAAVRRLREAIEALPPLDFEDDPPVDAVLRADVLVAIEREAAALVASGLRAALLRELPSILADIDDAGSEADDWTGSEYVDRLADGILAVIAAEYDRLEEVDS